MDALAALDAALSVLYAAILAWIWAYLRRLERTGCECARGFRRSFIMVFLALRVLAVAASLVAGPEVAAPLAMVMVPLDVVFVILTLQYVHRLKTTKCQCSDGLARDVLATVAIIDAALMMAVVVLALFVALMLRRHGGPAARAGSRR